MPTVGAKRPPTIYRESSGHYPTLNGGANATTTPPNTDSTYASRESQQMHDFRHLKSQLLTTLLAHHETANKADQNSD